MNWFEYINRGTDPRILGKVGALLQNLCSLPFWWLKDYQPIQVLICFFPPFLSFGFQWPFTQMFCTLRAGWRYDKGIGRYLADIILKFITTSLVHY